MAKPKISTEKMVQAEIEKIGKNFHDYVMKNFESFDSAIQHLVSFGDFRVFLPIVCDEDFNPVCLSLIKIDNPVSAKGAMIIARIYEEAKYLSVRSGNIPKSRIPVSGRVSLDMVSNFVNAKKVTTARMSARFFLPEMPEGAASTRFGKMLLERENIKRPISYNLLSVEKQYVDGLSPVVEYYMLYGRVLPLFHANNIKASDKISVNRLIRAIEDLDPITVALNIRTFEDIPDSQRSRMRNKLIAIGNSVVDNLRKKDRKYYFAFINGFKRAKVIP